MNARVALAVVVACVVAQSAAGQTSPRGTASAVQTQVAAAWQKFATDMKAGDSASAAAVFTPDAMIAYNTESRGTDAVRSYWARVIRASTYEDITYKTEDFTVAGDLATDFGILTQRYHRRAGGTSTTQRLRYAAIWKRQADGTWKLYRFIATVAALPTS